MLPWSIGYLLQETVEGYRGLLDIFSLRRAVHGYRGLLEIFSLRQLKVIVVSWISSPGDC